VEATKSRVGDRGDGDPDEDPTEKRDHGHARDVPRCVLAAERQADGDGVDHQGGAVVGEALGLQQHELAAGQALGQGSRGGGVGRGEDYPQKYSHIEPEIYARILISLLEGTMLKIKIEKNSNAIDDFLSFFDKIFKPY